MTLFKHSYSEELADVGTVSKSVIAKSEPGMAHFAGSGPDGWSCLSCLHLRSISAKSKKTGCSKYAELMRGAKLIAITGTAPACKYWERNPKARRK